MWKKYKHFTTSGPKTIGKILMVPQPEGLRCKVELDTYIYPNTLRSVLGFWFNEYGLRVDDYIHITIPKNEKYGGVISKLAEALYKLLQGQTPDTTQTQLTKEVSQ